MKLLALTSFLLLGILSFGAEYNLTLTFIDGYSNEAITGEKLTLEIVNIPLSKELTTDMKGSVNVKFEADKLIQYFFRFRSGNFEFQTHEHQLGASKNIELSFYLYPTEKYEKEILENETKKLSKLQEESADVNCIGKSFDKVLPQFDEVINKNLLLPSWYLNSGVKANFSVQVTLDKSGNLGQVKILESSDKNLNQEVIRLVRLMDDLEFTACEGDFKKTVTFPVVIERSASIK